MDKPTNDNYAFHGTAILPDAHGQAALLLVESLIHGLIERSVISVEDAVDIIATAVDTAEEITGDPENKHLAAQQTLAILRAIHQSLSHDL